MSYSSVITQQDAQRLHILFLGATGYIGGSFLERLHEHPQRPSHHIVAYLRDAHKAQLLETQFRMTTIIGSLDEVDKIEEAAAQADIVIHTAGSASHLPSALAILRGLKRRYDQTKKVPIYIHTSGTGVTLDLARGEHADAVTYDDTDVEQLRSIPENEMHRDVDLPILAADTEGYVRAYLVVPSTIYGLGTGPLFSSHLANPHSIQIPELIKCSIDRGRSGMVGPGHNVWPHVHIDDIANLFLHVFDGAVKNSRDAGHGWQGFYFGENGDYVYHALASEIGKALVNTGKIKVATPTSFTQAEIEKYFGGVPYPGSNLRMVGKRARALGWTPKHSMIDFYASVLPEVEAILAQPSHI